jgi:hypothetical protein
MFFGFILIRILFVACMVFIIGYVFGNFSARPALRRITRVAAILLIILFISSNFLLLRGRRWHDDRFMHRENCGWHQGDSVQIQR